MEERVVRKGAGVYSAVRAERENEAIDGNRAQ